MSRTELDKQLQKFWEIEEIYSERNHTQEERKCEEHFLKTHNRDAEDRFVVFVVFKDASPPLGASRGQAISRLLIIERRRRLSKNETILQFLFA